jgi:hypothetical protein
MAATFAAAESWTSSIGKGGWRALAASSSRRFFIYAG